jgi:CDP-paratose 2-epimerase
MQVLVTGSSGLIGSEAVAFFDKLGFRVDGIDNNMRADYFGPPGDTSWNQERLAAQCRGFRHYQIDIRDRDAVEQLFRKNAYGLIVHAAAQPSKELATRQPHLDFFVNAVGTLNLLEATRQHCPGAVFVFMSTNKVYGDGPNRVPLRETPSRFDFDDPRYEQGISEEFPIDRCLHSLFGVSKAAADLMVQEYGKYFGMKTGVFRGGCLTGPYHSGVELHGFLSYLVAMAVHEQPYTVIGYQGKQVRDQIHSYDVVNALWQFAKAPRPGEVYNLGGGKENAASLLECVEMIHARTGKRPELSYRKENRVGDHICYYSDLGKLREHYPEWKLTYSLERILDELIAAAQAGR